MPNREINLFKALSEFIKAMRLYISTGLESQYQGEWEIIYCNSLMPNQQEHWNRNIEDGIDPIQLIDYGNIKSFALNQRNFFERDFGRQKNNLPTIFNQMAEARNRLMHFLPFDDDKAQKAYLHMIDIAEKLELNELVNDLRELKDEFKVTEISTKKSKAGNENTKIKRLYTNREIQIKITEKAETLSDAELKKLCDEDYSRETFNNTYPIFVRVLANASNEERQKALKDHNNNNRWTIKYEFNNNGYCYFVTTMWYPRQDVYVQKWLNS